MATNGKSAIRLWVMIGLLSAILGVGFVIGVGYKISTTLSAVMSRTDNPSSIALHFAEALRTQNYTLAFGDFDSNATINGQALDQNAFIKVAQDADTQRGTVLFYGFLSDESDPAQLNVKLQRSGGAYEIHVRLIRVGNVWKISSIDIL